MSTINARQQVGHGVGGGYCSIDNAAFSIGGWAGWLDDDAIGFFANGGDGWIGSLIDQRTLAITRAITNPSDPQYGAGMNTGFAGGGVWAAWLGHGSPQSGLFASTGLRLPGAGLLGVGPDGAIAYKPDYNAMGPTIVRSVAGWEFVLTAGHASDLQLLGGDGAIWQEGNAIRVSGGLTQPLQVGPAYGPRAHLIGDRWWVSYWCERAGIVLHPFDELAGIVVVPPGVDAWHSARAFGSVVLFALSSGEGEQPGQVRREAFDVALLPLEPLIPDDGGGGDGGGGDGGDTGGGGDGGDTGGGGDGGDTGGGGDGGDGNGGDGGDVEPPTKGPIMIFIDIRQPNLAAEKCEEIDNGNGTFSYRKQSNGKIFCVTDTGAIEERDAPGGAFESFIKTPAALIADRPWNGEQHSYLLPYAEVVGS